MQRVDRLAAYEEFKNEIELARMLASAEIDENIVVSQIDKITNWGVFLNEVFKNKIAPLVAYHLEQYKLFDKVPRYVYRVLRTYRYYHKMKAKAYFDTIQDIAQMLEKAQIEYVFMKGFDIINKLYAHKSPYIREFNDIDILVLEEDLTKVERLFIDQGYVFGHYNEQEDRIVKASRFDIIRMRMDSHQIETLVKRVTYDESEEIIGPIYIDVNFTIFDGGKNKSPISTKELLSNRVKIQSFNNVEYYTLDMYDSFIQLVYHLYRESKFDLLKEAELDITLHKFCDIHEYLLKMEKTWDWKNLRSIIDKYELQEAFWFVLYFCDLLYGTEYLMFVFGTEINYSDKYCSYVQGFKKRFGIQ